MDTLSDKCLTDIVHVYLENVRYVNRGTYKAVLEMMINNLDQNGFRIIHEAGLFTICDKQEQSQQQQQATTTTPLIKSSPPPHSTTALVPTPSPVKQRMTKRPHCSQRHESTSKRARKLQFEIHNLSQLKTSILAAKECEVKIEPVEKDLALAPVVDIDQQLTIELNDLGKAKRLAKYYNQLNSMKKMAKSLKLKACARLFELYSKTKLSSEGYTKHFGELKPTIRNMLRIGQKLSIVQDFAGVNILVYELDAIKDINFNYLNQSVRRVFMKSE